MIELYIDEKTIKVSKDSSILDAALSHDIEIPNMCHLENQTGNTSCMLCVVEIEGIEKLQLSCAVKVKEGMRVISNSNRINEVRKKAIELLLSEHQGDCIALCQKSCPYNFNIPLMLRYIQKGDFFSAKILIRETPDFTEHSCEICKGYCEKACRRKTVDQSISIKSLITYTIQCTVKSSSEKEFIQDNKINNLQKEKDKKNSFSSIMKNLNNEELRELAKGKPDKQLNENNITSDTAINEALRCMHCDCRKKDNCLLRNYADTLNANQTYYKGCRKELQVIDLDEIILEPAKCISCGICDKISEIHCVDFGFTFLNRGFSITPTVPFNNYKDEKLKKLFKLYVDSCPTGALSWKND